uniref:Uncharacterized protein n=1 Tax=Panagrellus redivivus TaxID=6233 RepID=A0A7E4ZXB7_PANRE
MNRDDHWVRFLWIIVGLLDGCGAIVQQLPILSSCQFPVPGNREFFNRMCRPYTQLPFMCDIHGQLEPRVVPLVAEVYARHRAAFKTDNGTDLFGIALVRQLSQPSSTLFVTPESDEFKCIFAPPCHGINNDQVERFVDNFKYFTKVYTSVLFRRWFPEITCPRPRILALVLTEGVINDPRKLTTVVIYTQEAKLRPFLANIQFEITNSLLHGNPLHEALADLINQIGYAVREYYATNGTPRHHGIPLWAFQLTAVSVALVIVAMIVEWCIVRRKLLSNRNHTAFPIGGRSKTHLIF